MFLATSWAAVTVASRVHPAFDAALLRVFAALPTAVSLVLSAFVTLVLRVLAALVRIVPLVLEVLAASHSFSRAVLSVLSVLSCVRMS